MHARTLCQLPHPHLKKKQHTHGRYDRWMHSIDRAAEPWGNATRRGGKNAHEDRRTTGTRRGERRPSPPQQVGNKPESWSTSHNRIRGMEPRGRKRNVYKAASTTPGKAHEKRLVALHAFRAPTRPPPVRKSAPPTSTAVGHQDGLQGRFLPNILLGVTALTALTSALGRAGIGPRPWSIRAAAASPPPLPRLVSG